MQITAKFRKVCASVAVAGVAMLGLIPAAYADDNGAAGSGTATALPSTITESTGSIIIHKHEQPTTPGAPADGMPKTGVEKPIQGVTFKVTKVGNFDLKTNAGWEAASKAIAQYKKDGTFGDGVSLGTAKTSAATAADGSTTVGDLPIGLYLVEEDSITGAKNAEGEAIKVAKAAPFLVTIPMVNPDTKAWNYNINVYPKNTTLAGKKEVADDGANVGDKVTYTITTDIPYIEGDKSLSKYVVVDKLPAGMEFEKADGDIEVSLTAGGTLAADDYTVTAAKANPVKITFTEKGLKTLADARRAEATAQVKVVLKVKITEFKEDGYANTAFFAPSTDFSDDPDDPNNPPLPSDEVVTKLGQVQIVKFAAGDDAKTMLPGATFKITRCDDAKATPITIDGVSSWTTKAGEDLIIKGLHVSDFANGKAADKAIEYCAYETAAPEGYQIAPEPYKFQVTADNMKTPVKVEVPNVKANGGIELPLTGSQALGILTIAGVFLVLGSIALLGGRRRATN